MADNDSIQASDGFGSMFIGESDHTVDAKSRVFLPKRFQDELDRDAEGNLICMVTPGLDECLYLFSASGFRRAIQRLDTNAFTAEKVRDIQRDFFPQVSKVKLDSSGRLLIPESLREKLNGTREVTMVGCMERAELWPKKVHDERKGRSNGLKTLDDILSGRLPGEGKSASNDG